MAIEVPNMIQVPSSTEDNIMEEDVLHFNPTRVPFLTSFPSMNEIRSSCSNSTNLGEKS